MKRKVIIVGLVAAIACVAFAQTGKLNLSGAWERVALGGVGNQGTEVMTFVHNEPYLYLLYRIKDAAGERTLDLKGKIDGKPHTQEIDGQPATLMAQWEGQKLLTSLAS